MDERRELLPARIDEYQELANEIVVTACDDYRRALKILSRHPGNIDALREKESIENFFESEWFGILTNIDSALLLSRLQKEAMKT